MRRGLRITSRTAAVALAASLSASLGGCVSIARAVLIPKFKMDVPAGQLASVAAPAPDVAADAGVAPSASPAAPAPPTAALTSLPASAEAAPPERTDIKGQGDGSMKIDRIVVTGARPIPHRAPNYSAEQVAAMVCISERFGFRSAAARRAHEATLAARDARADLSAHRINEKKADEAELKRQAAVRAFMAPIPLLNMLGDTGQKKSDLPAPKYRGVVIENTDLFTFKENGKEVIAVTGTLRNTGKTRIELPPLTLRALDDWEFSLAGQTSLLPFEALDPGEARTFELRFLNPPEYVGEVYIHFAPPFIYRAPRDCDFFDPEKFDPDKPLGDTSQPADSLTPPKLDIASIRRFVADSGPHAGATTPDYTAAELNILTRYYRGEAELAWRCQSSDVPAEARRCRRGPDASAAASSDGGQRLGWRDLFAMAEAIDEAWVAVHAVGEAKPAREANKGSPAEVDAAEAASAKAIARFRAMGAAALARAGGSVANVVVELTQSTFGYDGKQIYVDIAGRMRNTGSGPRKVDALMIAAVDRFELPLSSTAAPDAMELAPGASVAFSQRVPLYRPPPRQLDWSIRVGAMASLPPR